MLQKQEMIEMLSDDGDVGTAHQVATQLPDVVDLDKDSEVLREHRVDIEHLLSRR